VLKEYHSVSALREGLEVYFHYYNNERTHQSLENLTPAEVYGFTALGRINFRKVSAKQNKNRKIFNIAMIISYSNNISAGVITTGHLSGQHY